MFQLQWLLEDERLFAVRSDNLDALQITKQSIYSVYPGTKFIVRDSQGVKVEVNWIRDFELLTDEISMWCIVITASGYKEVVGPFKSAKKAADFAGTRLVLKDGRSAAVIKMDDPASLNSQGFKVR